MTGRDGRYSIGSISGDLVPFSLHVEFLEEQRLYVLVRIEMYRKYVPPHCGEVLREFAKRVNITINGFKVYGPPEVDPAVGSYVGGIKCPVDGLISRVAGKDYYLKPGWTADLDPPSVNNLRLRCEKQGLVLTCDRVGAGLCEYKIIKSGNTVALQCSKERRDKKAVTSLSTVDYMLSLPTLNEAVAVLGYSPQVEAVQHFFFEL